MLTSACSLVASNIVNELQQTFGAEIEQYTQLKPEMQRVLALESDMRVIVDELGKHSNLGTDPLAAPSDVEDNAATQVASQNAQSPNGLSVVVATPYDLPPCNISQQPTLHCHRVIGLHIAAFSDAKFISSGWQHIKQMLPGDLKEKQPLSAPIRKNNMTYHSLRIGPFTSVATAKRACDSLALPSRCSVTEYYGQRIIKAG